MRFWWILGWLSIPLLALAQRDTQEAAVFTSVELEEVTYEGFSITAGYYTIANNIDNRQSKAFISDVPSPEEYIYFARHQPSYYFLVHRQREVIRMITLEQRPHERSSTFYYTIFDPVSGYRTIAASRLSGELTQWRAQELRGRVEKGTAGTLARITLTDKMDLSYPVQPFDAVRQEVVELARRLVNKERTQAEDLEEYIRTETVGGTLDFKVALAKEARQRFSRDGVTYNKHNFSVLLWGGAVRTLGLSTVRSACLLWEDIQQRSLTVPEAEALRRGFAEESELRYENAEK